MTQCDGCGKPINGSYVIDNDLILCPACFIRIYRPSIEKYLGVVVVCREVDAE